MASSETLHVVRTSDGMNGLPELVSAYVGAMVQRGLSSNTIAAREGFARARLRDWGTLDLGTDDLAAWLGQFTGHTRRTYHDHLRSLYRFLVDAERIAESPIAPLPRPPSPKPNPRPLSREDAARSLLGASGDLRAHLLLGRYAGLRAHEIAKLRGQDVDEDTLYVNGKGGKIEILPTHPALWELAQNYPRRGYWFPSKRSRAGHIAGHTVSLRVTQHFERLGIDGSSHRNRHLYGTNLLRDGANIRVVQELMRHSDITTTIKYLGVDQEEKVAAIRRLSA